MEHLLVYKEKATEASEDFLQEMSKLLTIGNSHPELDIDDDYDYHSQEFEIPPEMAEQKFPDQLTKVSKARKEAYNAAFEFNENIFDYRETKRENGEEIPQRYFLLRESDEEIRQLNKQLNDNFQDIRVEVLKSLGEENLDNPEIASADYQNATY